MNGSRRRFIKALAGLSAVALVRPSRALEPIGSSSDLDLLVDPDLFAAARDLSSLAAPALSDGSLSSARRWMRTFDPKPLTHPAIVERVIPGSAGQPPVKILVTGLKNSKRLRPAVIHIHGGGFVLGSPWGDAVHCQTLSMELDCVVISVDYRLAPETRFPGALEDNYAALRWLHSHAESLGVDASRIAVKGESGGGGHAAMLAIAARNRREFPICYLVLLYPMLDDRTGSGIEPSPQQGAYVWSRANNRYGWSALLGLPAGSPAPPKGAVPARETDLSDLPPTFIGVGSLDLFVDEDISFARRLLDFGVPTELVVEAGAYHGFDEVAPDAPISRQFTRAWMSAIRSALERRP